MKRTVVALIVTSLGVAGAGVAAAGGNGAQKAGLAEKSALLACSPATAAESGQQTANGFVVLNAAGRPAKQGKKAREDGTRKLVGTVALKNAAGSASYDVHVATSGCGDRIGTLTTNDQGNGNLSFSEEQLGAGTYYVLLVQRPLPGVPVLGELVRQQQFASAPVTVR